MLEKRPEVTAVMPQDLKGRLEEGQADRFAGAEPPKSVNVKPMRVEAQPKPQPTGKWIVWVYRNADGRWEKQENETYSSDDQDVARKYFENAKKRAGFTATSNLPSKLDGGNQSRERESASSNFPQDRTTAPVVDLADTVWSHEFFPGGSSALLVFKCDGTIQEGWLSYNKNTLDSSAHGTWKVTNNTVIINYTNKENSQGTVSGNVMTFQVNGSLKELTFRLSNRGKLEWDDARDGP